MRKTLHEFVIEQTEDEKAAMLDVKWGMIYNYAKLTNRAPKLSDFVPCDDSDKPITLSERVDKPEHERVEEQNKYQKALNNVIFDGDWEVELDDSDLVRIRHKKEHVRLSFTMGQCYDFRTSFLITRIEDLPKEITFKEGVA